MEGRGGEVGRWIAKDDGMQISSQKNKSTVRTVRGKNYLKKTLSFLHSSNLHHK